jgi:hypothetical protein
MAPPAANPRNRPAAVSTIGSCAAIAIPGVIARSPRPATPIATSRRAIPLRDGGLSMGAELLATNRD